MLDQLTPEVRHELAAARVAALHRSAEHRPAGRLRRTAGTALVRLGLRLGHDGSVPPFVSQLAREEEASAHAGASLLRSARRTRPRVATIATWDDFQRELAAPYGVRVGRRSTSGQPVT